MWVILNFDDDFNFDMFYNEILKKQDTLNKNILEIFIPAFISFIDTKIVYHFIFQGYIFLKLQDTINLPTFDKIFRVRYVTNKNEVSIISDAEIDRMKNSLDEIFDDRTKYPENQKLKIVDGLYSGYTCKYLKTRSYFIAVEVTGKSFVKKVTLPFWYLEV